MVGSLAVGQTLIILTAGIDLSVGSIMVLASFLAANLIYTDHTSVPLALLVALLSRWRRRRSTDCWSHA